MPDREDDSCQQKPAGRIEVSKVWFEPVQSNVFLLLTHIERPWIVHSFGSSVWPPDDCKQTH